MSASLGEEGWLGWWLGGRGEEALYTIPPHTKQLCTGLLVDEGQDVVVHLDDLVSLLQNLIEWLQIHQGCNELFRNATLPK